MKNNLIIILVLALILISFGSGYFVRKATFKPLTPGSDTIVQTNVIYQDTGTHTVTLKPIPYKVIESKIDSFMYEVDTAAILSAYYETLIYDTILVDDSDTYISMESAIYMNDFLYFRYNYQNKRVTKIVNTYPPVKTNRISFGATCGINTFAPTVSYSNDKWTFRSSYNLRESIEAKKINLTVERSILKW